MSVQIDSDERNELDALRLENDTLRRHLGSLEDKIQRAEENTLTQGRAAVTTTAGAGGIAVQPSMASMCDTSMCGSSIYGTSLCAPSMCGTSIWGSAEKDSSPPEVRQLHGILQWLDKAKADIVDGDRSKLQLERDVRLLYDLLERAKKERRCYGAVVKGLERSLKAAEERRAKVEEELDLQQRSFGKVLRKDRDVYEARTDAAERRGEELKKVMSWVDKYEAKYKEAMGKLSAQAEEVGAANLGDLEGFTRDMAAEVTRIRKAVDEEAIAAR